MDATRSRGWVFTINNPTEEDQRLVNILKDACEYLVYGKETGQSGTFHFQGFVRFKNQVSFKRVKAYLPRAHFEVQRGTATEAANYCKKDGDFEEHGTCPVTKATVQEQYRECIKLARIGDLDSIADLYPGIYLRYLSTFRSLRLGRGDILDELVNEWWVGPTGTGKSRTLWQMYPDHYGKALNKWWDGYEGQETVAIEEWSPSNECTGSQLKIWADRYPFNAQIKGGTLLKIRPKRLIVLSNYTIEECFTNVQDLGPIKRRFKVRHFRAFFTNEEIPSLEDLIE